MIPIGMLRCEAAPLSTCDQDIVTKSPERSALVSPYSQSPDCIPSLHPAASPIARSLGSFVALDSDDLRELTFICQNDQRVRHNQILFHEQDRCDHVALMLEGLACRYKVLSSGRRQILGYLIPGDICDTSFLVSNISDYGVAALGESRIATASIERFAALVRKHPNIAHGVSLMSLRDTATLREWLLNIGRRNAFQRLCHFFCEISVRLKRVGLEDPDHSILLPVSQAALADTIGLTEVHVNRTLQRLRSAGLISFQGRHLRILDFPQLAQLAEFDDHYLAVRFSSSG